MNKTRKMKFGFLEHSTVYCPCCEAGYVFRDDKLILILDDDLFLFPEAKKRDDGIYMCEECGITFEMAEGETSPVDLIKLAMLREKEIQESQLNKNKKKRLFDFFGKNAADENEREL